MTKEEIIELRRVLALFVPATNTEERLVRLGEKWLSLLEAANERLARIDAAADRWDHMDHLFSDEQWMKASAGWKADMIYDLWAAIRKPEKETEG